MNLKMKKLIIAFTLALCASAASVAAPVAAPNPEPQYHRADHNGVTVEGYYYNYTEGEMRTVTLRVNHRKVVAFWNNNVWNPCSIRIQKNETGDISEDTPESWRKFSKKLMYKAVVNQITLYFDTENT